MPAPAPGGPAVAGPRSDMAALIVAEPPSAYARRPRLVVDASVVAAALFAEPEALAAGL